MTDSTRQQLEQAENLQLAPYALRAADATRQMPIEDEGRVFDYRSQFQRDRDRLIYSRAFRRLRQKAVVGILPDYEDHRRNRLTHTLEVAQIARTLGRALQLNEDLIETVALGHDLGQPPFGPAGVRALDDMLTGRLDGKGGPGLGDLGGFWRAWQGLRVVDHLEKRYEHAGLNLTDPVREGILKSGSVFRTPAETFEGVRPELEPSFEVQLVKLADRISSALSDLDDALQAGVLELAQVERLFAVRKLRDKLGPTYNPRAGRFMKANTIHRGLAHMLVTGIILASGLNLTRWAETNGVATHEDFLERFAAGLRGDEICLPRTGLKMLEDLEGFLGLNVHRGHDFDQVDSKARRVLLGLFAAYYADPALLQDHLLLRYKEIAGGRFLRDVPSAERIQEVDTRYRGQRHFVRLLADHLAAMTDVYALTEYDRLIHEGAVPIPSAEQLRRET